ncbi:hypothetical protein [Streptomyces sp. NPDC088115]|uniref:hypothetical protein n=1 Tax=Streptomyces sp. NPDC088115 TaxID=3365824 RepID=UPI00381D28AD
MPTHNDLRTRLTAAAARLREIDSPNLADAIDAIDTVLAPQGWTHLRNTDATISTGTEPNMPIWMGKTVKGEIVAAVADAGTTVTADVNEAFMKFLAGEFVAGEAVRPRMSAARKEMANLNVRPSSVLREQVAAAGETPSRVAGDYLMRKYSLGPYAADYKDSTLAPGNVRIPEVPRPVREAIRKAAAAAGHKVDDDVNEGFQKFLAGEFVPTAPAWPGTADMVPMKIRPNNDLHDQVRGAGGLRPTQVAVAYLLNKYGIDPAAITE